MKTNFDAWKKTGLERYKMSYEYWLGEKERILAQYFMPRITDEQYASLDIY